MERQRSGSSTKRLIQVFRDQPEGEVLESELVTATQMLANESPPIINNDDVGILINHISDWLVDNSHSNAVRPVLRYLDLVLEVLGFRLEDSAEDNSDDVSSPENTSLYFKQEFGTIVLSLITTILKDEQFWNYRILLFALLKIVNRLIGVQNMPILYKKSGIAKALLALVKLVMNLESWDEVISSSILVCMHMFSKFVRASSKTREYFVRKSGIQITQALMKNDKGLIAETYSSAFQQACCLVLAHTAVTQDFRLTIWIGGPLPILIEEIRKQIQGPASEDGGQTLEHVYYLLMALVNGNEEVQDDLMKFDFLKLSVASINRFPKRKFLIAYVMGTIRRLAGNPSYRRVIAADTLHTLLDLGTFLGKLEAELAIKELNATMGALASEPIHGVEIGKNGGIEIVVTSALKYYRQAKIIKTSLGSLINLSSQEENRKIIAKTEHFYLLIYYSIEEHKRSGPIIDYALKVILNTADEDICLNNYISGGLYMKLLEFLEVYSKNFNICYAALRVLRRLISYNKRAFDNFLRVLIKTYGTEEFSEGGTVTPYTSSAKYQSASFGGRPTQDKLNPKDVGPAKKLHEEELEDPFGSLLRVFARVLSENEDSVTLISEVISILSVLENRSSVFSKVFSADEFMVSSIKKFIQKHKHDRVVMTAISEHLAGLSIEDLPLMD